MIYNVLSYGIVGNGTENNTDKINELTRKIAAEGGGEIYFPKGNYVTGTIFLYSNMVLHLDAGATLLGSENFNDFPFVKTEGFTRNTHWSIIASLGEENITVKGEGVIDGRGKIWWESGKDDYVRPRTISFIKCKNVSIEGIKILNSPCWSVHPICCENVNIFGISIKNPYNSPNTDGINPESCSNVKISNCHIDVGDDCIAIKAGTENDTLQKEYACENIIISNCIMAHGHGAVVFGSEMSGGVKNVTVSHCVFNNTDRGIRIKTRRGRGGYVKGLKLENITMNNLEAFFTINEYYIYGGELTVPKEIVFSQEKQEITPLTPKISDISISKINGENIKGVGIYFYGLPEAPIENVYIKDVNLSVTGCEGVDAVMAYDRENVSGEGIFLQNAKNILMSDVNINCTKEELTVISCQELNINGEKL